MLLLFAKPWVMETPTARAALLILLAVSLSSCARESGKNAVKGSEAAHPKSVTDIKARIDAEAKMPPEMKARYKAQAENSAKP